MEWSDRALVLGSRVHGERDCVLEVFGRVHGRSLGLVRGGRSSRRVATLQTGNSLDVTWRARLDEHLGHFAVEPVTDRAARLIADRAGVALVQTLAAELRLCAERDPHPDLHDAAVLLLDHVAGRSGAGPASGPGPGRELGLGADRDGGPPAAPTVEVADRATAGAGEGRAGDGGSGDGGAGGPPAAMGVTVAAGATTMAAAIADAAAATAAGGATRTATVAGGAARAAAGPAPADLAALAGLVRFEMMLLADLGFGLDLSVCALTGTTEDLAFVSPRTGRAACRAAGEPYAARLLRLPPFLAGTVDAAPSAPDIADGLRLTAHFLARDLWQPRRLTEPESRRGLAQGLA